MVTLHEDQYTFLIISCSNLLKIKNVDIICRENKPHILCSVIFFLVENCAVYEIMWEKTV